MTYSNTFSLTTNNRQAQSLYNAADRFNGQFIVDGIDITDALRVMAAAYTGTQEALGGVSNGGLHQSMQRVGRVLTQGGERLTETTRFKTDEFKYQVRTGEAVANDWDWIRYGDLKAFGMTRAVWGPGSETEDSIIMNPRALFSPLWEQAALEVYQLSDRCRADEFQAQLGQIRGVYLLFRLQNLFNTDAEQNEHNSKATRRYSSMLARLFAGDVDQNYEAAGILIADFERTGVFELV